MDVWWWTFFREKRADGEEMRFGENILGTKFLERRSELAVEVRQLSSYCSERRENRVCSCFHGGPVFELKGGIEGFDKSKVEKATED